LRFWERALSLFSLSPSLHLCLPPSLTHSPSIPLPPLSLPPLSLSLPPSLLRFLVEVNNAVVYLYVCVVLFPQTNCNTCIALLRQRSCGNRTTHTYKYTTALFTCNTCIALLRQRKARVYIHMHMHKDCRSGFCVILHLHIYICIQMYVCMYVCIYIYIYVYIYIYILCVCVYIYVYQSPSMRALMY
jgi:hypothetical protein